MIATVTGFIGNTIVFFIGVGVLIGVAAALIVRRK